MKETPTFKRLNDHIEDIKCDLKAGASFEFLGRKYHTTRQTMKAFLVWAGLIEK